MIRLYVYKKNLINLLILLIITNKSYASVNCNLQTSEINFGQLVGVQTILANSIITVICYNNSETEQRVSYLIKFNKMFNGLKSGASIINYNIYSDSNYSNLLGDGSSNSSVLSNSYQLLPFSNRSDSFQIYSKIIIDGFTTVGDYLDKILVTLEY